MSSHLKICEHESVEWVIKKLPTFSKHIFLKKHKIIVTSFDVNSDVFIIGTNTGVLHYIDRKSYNVQTLLLKKDKTISEIKIIQTIDLSIASGTDDGSVFIFKINTRNEQSFCDANQFNVPVDHASAITYMAWSKNSEKLFTGDSTGSVFCTEVNNANKTVSSYRIYDANSQIIYLSYSYKSLIISSEKESFIYNLSTNSRTSIGTKSRLAGIFGACFIDKLCRPEEVEIVVVRPDTKLWISDLNGIIKRSILLKSETLFSTEKSISMLPCLTSQSNTSYMEKLRTGAIKHQLGLVSSISENEVLFWSKNGIIIFDISSGKVLSSSCNLGIVLSVSVCRFNNTTDNDLAFPERRNLFKDLLEIWILRKPLGSDESALVRLSNLPLTTSKLTIDPFNYVSERSDFKCSNYPTNSVSETIPSEYSDAKREIITNQDVTVTVKHRENWLPNFDINVPDTFNDMRSNVIELTKKTKEIFKHSHDIFDNNNEGVEQALELTEEGLIIKFGENTDVKTIFLKNSDVIPNNKTEGEIFNVVKNDIITKNPRKNVRKIHLVDIDDNSLGDDSSEDFPVIQDYTIERQTAADVIEQANRLLSKDNETSSKFDLFQNDSGSEEPQNIFDELNASRDGKALSRSTNNTTSPAICIVNLSEIQKEKPESESKSYEIIHEMEWSNTLKTSSVVGSPDKGSFSETGLSDNASMDIVNVPFNISVSNDGPTMKNQISEYNIEECFTMFKKSTELSKCINETSDPILTNKILSGCNKWISHRGPSLGNHKITSLSINRRMIWITDSKCCLHVGFRNNGEDFSDQKKNTISNIQWFQNNLLQTDKIYSSPEGVIVWRDKSSDILVYTGLTKIWTPKVVKEKVLLKSNWEIMMLNIKDIDIDNDMAVIVTKKGKLKVMDGLSDRSYYKQSHTASITGHVTIATTLNGIIWCVTEIMDPDSKIATQHIFSCVAKDEDGKLDISYWRTVPIPKDLIIDKEEHLGILGGSLEIKYLQLGACGLAWIVTVHSGCFFSRDVCLENPTGDGIWYQISLNFLFQILTPTDESWGFGFDTFPYGIQSRVEKIFGYSETRVRRNLSNSMLPSVLISTKSAPKRSLGNGLVWVTSMEKCSPTVLFESDKDILGHRWIDCFSDAIQKQAIALPVTLQWSSVTFGFENVLWLLSNSNEIFCYWNETRIRNIMVPSSFGNVSEIVAHNNIVLILTIKSYILIRIGITAGNPIGTDWKEINNTWNVNKETIKCISCFENEIWVLTFENIYFNEDLRSLACNISKKCPWKSLKIKIGESFTNTFSSMQVISKPPAKRYIWLCSELDGRVYLGEWADSTMCFDLTYIPGPRAKYVHVSNENVWMVEEISGEIFVLCGIDWACKATGDYWSHIPLTTTPVISLSVSMYNEVVVINCKHRLLSHKWSIVKSAVTNRLSDNEVSFNYLCRNKSEDGDWELLN